MRQLLNGIIQYRKHYLPKNKHRFEHLVKGQRPDALFVACADSRVVPNLFASTHPGELFVVRNVGNMVPRYEDASKLAFSETAALEFALTNLSVRDVIICGHAECGAMMASLALDIQTPCTCHHHGDSHRHTVADSPYPPAVQHWLQHTISPVVKAYKDGTGRLPMEPGLSAHNYLAQMNVLYQLEHLEDYPVGESCTRLVFPLLLLLLPLLFRESSLSIVESISHAVKKRLEDRTLRLHAWYFDIKEGNVLSFEKNKNKFMLIDENYVAMRDAARAMKRTESPSEPDLPLPYPGDGPAGYPVDIDRIAPYF